MATKLQLVDRFETIVTGAVTVGAPLSTANIALGNVTGLSTTGLNSLEIYRADVGRVPTYVDTIYGWTSIVGLSLQAAVRTTGAALSAGDLVYAVFNKQVWDSFLGYFDTIVTTAAELVTALAPASTARNILVADGSYSLTANIGPQSYQRIQWGDGSVDGWVTLDFGANNASLTTMSSSQDYQYTYVATTSFTAANPTRITRSAGSWANPCAGFKVYIAGDEYTIDTRESNTEVTVTAPYPTVDQKSRLSTYDTIVCVDTMVTDVTMTGRLRVTGSGAYSSVELQGYRWDTSGLQIETTNRDPTVSPVLLQFIRSRIGPVSVIGTAGSASFGTVNLRAIYVRAAQMSTFDRLFVDKWHLQNTNAATTLTMSGINVYYCVDSFINVHIRSVHTRYAGAAPSVYGLFTGNSFKLVEEGSIADIYKTADGVTWVAGTANSTSSATDCKTGNLAIA